jgi:NADH dehydrogenase
MSHRIVIVGGGAGKLELATRLGRTLGKRARATITLVDCHLTHVWKPLLHEVAAGSLNTPANELNYVAQAKWNHFQFRYGRLSGIDRENKTVRLRSAPGGGAPAIETSLEYDTLVIAVGSVANDFNTPGAAEHCIFPDTPEQATQFHRLLLAHYLAAQANPRADASLGIAIVGAGATGVELAAELASAAMELAAYGLSAIKPENVRITVLDGAPRVLPGLSERISGEARATLDRLGIDVITCARATEVTAEGIRTADGTLVEATLKVWAAGIKAPAFLRQLDGLETNRINQLVVRPSLQTSMDDNIFAFGDCAACPLMRHSTPRAGSPCAASAFVPCLPLRSPSTTWGKRAWPSRPRPCRHSRRPSMPWRQTASPSARYMSTKPQAMSPAACSKGPPSRTTSWRAATSTSKKPLAGPVRFSMRTSLPSNRTASPGLYWRRHRYPGKLCAV